MRSGRAKLTTAVAVALSVTLLLGACGGDDDEPRANDEPRAKPSAAKLPSTAAVDADPYAIACGHVRDQQRWAGLTRRTTVAIGDRERIAGLSRLQATQSLFFAMTELCKGRPASFQPAQAAVRAVAHGRYRALGAP